MKKTIITLWMTGLVCAVSAAVSAQDAPLIPDIPALPSFGSDGSYDPGNPFSPPPPGLLEPMSVPDLPTGDNNSSAVSLPLPKDDDEFDFFQPGMQLRDGEGDDKNKTTDVVVEAPKPVIKKLRRKPLFVNRFNFKIQKLPPPIYKKQYGRENRHLPKAMYEHDYDAVTFAAAARNDLNGLRAMINAGRNIQMRNASGQGLAQVAARSGAHDVLRYLAARGAGMSQVAGIAQQRRDNQAYYTAVSAGAR